MMEVTEVEEHMFWCETIDLMFDSSSSSSEDVNESSDSEDIVEGYLSLILQNGKRGTLQRRPRQMDYVEKIVAGYSACEFKRNFRVTPETFDFLLQQVGPHLTKDASKCGRCPIPAKKQLLIALWFMATPDSYRSVCNCFNVGAATAHRTLSRVCCALHCLAPLFIKWPRGAEVANVWEGFRTKSEFPKVIGAMDGCHIRIRAPKIHPEAYVNRKSQHSIQFQAVCDSRLIFTHIYAGQVGSVHDQRVFNLSEVSTFLESPLEYFPDDSNLVADAAYRLRSQIMVPFKNNGHLTNRHTNYNYQLSLARVVIERVFGLLKARFRSLLDCLPLTNVRKIPRYIVACCVLHNICQLKRDELEADLEIVQPENDNEVHAPHIVHADGEGIVKRNRISFALAPH